jgi:1-acyl-sn-glycerol-3-phosphate acyltransferase
MEHLPADPPFILVANHSSHLDALALAAVLHGKASRRLYTLAAGDMFFSNSVVSAFAAYAINAMPVWRRMRGGSAGMIAMRERLVEDALVYALFPEGTRSRTGQMARFKPGIGLLVAGIEVPVVPCWIDGAFVAWPPAHNFPRPYPLAVRIGSPLLFTTESNNAAGWARIAAACETAVRTLGGGAMD